MKKRKRATYADSGVNISAGNKAVDLIRGTAEKTFRFIKGKVLSGISGFSAAVELDNGNVIATSTDGVGTKLMIAILLNRHDTVGIDLVAMCVNDIIVGGVKPMLFLNYLATGKQVPGQTKTIIGGIAEGCERAECALIGGEMAELSGMYNEGEYDLAGFAVGFARSKHELILGDRIKPGMKVYGLLSSGLHSNGFSLVRKLFKISLDRPKSSVKNLNRYYGALRRTLGEELLEPTRIYVKSVKKLVEKYDIAGMAHITGGGLIENPARILPEGCAIKFTEACWVTFSIFRLIQKLGNVSKDEMRRTFNNGIGLVIVSPDNISEAMLIGEIVQQIGKKKIIFS